MKKVVFLFLAILSMAAQAQKYVVWFYDAKPIPHKKKLFNCKALTNHPIRYEENKGKISYSKNNFFKLENYHRLSALKVSSDLNLYKGRVDISPKRSKHSEEKIAKQALYVVFVALKDLSIVRGSWSVANCEGLLIGSPES